jgi:hypothetical protein
MASKTCVTSVRKFDAVLAGEPICCRPAIEKVARVFSKAPFAGMPGILKLCDGEEASWVACRSIFLLV